MDKYSKEHCNIKDCNKPHYKTFLCRGHYKTYVIDARIKAILERQFRLVFGGATVKDKFIRILNGFFHYFLHVSFYYEEHFLLETLFHYHYKNVDIKNNKFYKAENFINDFDHKYNDRIGYLKTYANSKDSQDVVLKFIETPIKNFTAIFGLIYATFAAIYISAIWIFQIEMPHKTIFNNIVVIGFVALPAIFYGVQYLKSCQAVMMQALESNLYKSIEDNNKFLQKCESIFNRMGIYREVRFSCLGVIFAFFIFFLQSLYNDIGDFAWYSIAICYLLALLGIYMFICILRLLWLNYFFMPLSRRFEDAPFKFDLYKLDKSLGINVLKTFIRNLFIYDILALFVLFTAARYVSPDYAILMSLLFLLTGWNTASLLIFVPNLNAVLQKQFKIEVAHQKEILSSSTQSDRFDKYSFLENLKLNVFVNFAVLKKLLIGSIMFVVTFVISYYDDFIMKKIEPFIEELRSLSWIFK